MAEEIKTSGTTPSSAAPQGGAKKPPEPKWLYYILSFVVAIFGIIFGIVYLVKDGEENKKFGKMCLILGLAPSVLGCLCWLIMLVIGLFTGGTTTSVSY